MPVTDAFALMPLTTTFALVLTFSIAALLVLMFPVRASAAATEDGKPWSLGAQLSLRLSGTVAAVSLVVSFVAMLVFAFIESM